MSSARFRQIARLQKLALPYIKWRQRIEREWQQTFDGAAAHAAILAFLIRYGNPKIDEPLSNACQRCCDSSAWKKCCERFPISLLDWTKEHHFEPYNRDLVSIIGMPLRHGVISIFPGADEKEKLDAVFASAPTWLIWFTFGDYTAKLLGLTVPDLSDVASFERSKDNFKLWWGLPRGAFERRPWPYDPDSEPLARTDLALLRPSMGSTDAHKTPRERRRERAMKSLQIKHTDDWPHLLAPEFLEMPTGQKLALLRRFGRI